MVGKFVDQKPKMVITTGQSFDMGLHVKMNK